MNFRFLIFLLFHTIVICSSHLCSNPVQNATKTIEIPDYYWKDYVGIIPEDATEGGTDENGNPTYVGQAYIRGFEFLPVIIYPGCKTATTSAYGAEITTDQHIKILCGKDKEKFEWIFTKNEETHLLTNRHLVVGGSEIGQTLNIGRVKHGGRFIIGKVYSYPLINRGLWIPYNGIHHNYLSYEILTYNYDKKTESTRKPESVNRPQTLITINVWNDECT